MQKGIFSILLAAFLVVFFAGTSFAQTAEELRAAIEKKRQEEQQLDSQIKAVQSQLDVTAGEKQSHTAPQGMGDDIRRFHVQVAQKPSQIEQEVLMAIAASGRRPRAVSMSAQIQRNDMRWGSSAAGQRRDEHIPASRVVAVAVRQN